MAPDILQSLRLFRQNKGFAITAIAAVSLGIAVNTAVFSVVNAVLMKPLHAPDPGRVVAFMSGNSESSNNGAAETKFNFWRTETGIFDHISGYYYRQAVLKGMGQTVPVQTAYVTADYFRLFGLPVARGRGFEGEELRVGAPGAMVLSDSFWRRTFGADGAVIGQTLSIGDSSYVVTGVLAAGAETEAPTPPDVWLSFPIDPNSGNRVHYFWVAGRLKSGVTIEAANARLRVTSEEYLRRYPSGMPDHLRERHWVRPLQEDLVQDARGTLLVLAAAVALVLLIACANVAGLLLARAAARRREIAVRFAVGAPRWRILRQLMVESFLLAGAGGLLGTAMGIVGIRALLAVYPVNIPRLGPSGANATLDWRVLAFAAAACGLTALLFGLIPALQASRAKLHSDLKEDGARIGGGRRQGRVRALLVAGEVGLAVVLLIGSGLLIQTLAALRAVDPGFDSRNVVVTNTPVDPKLAGVASAHQIIGETLGRLGALPGVESAGYTRLLPLDGGHNAMPIIVEGRPLDRPYHGVARWVAVSDGYFQTLKIPLVRGRGFSGIDDLNSPGVAVVNQAMARDLWPDGGALEARIWIAKGYPALEEPSRKIVGIVGDIRESSLGAAAEPTVFVPGAQLPEARVTGRSVFWVVRTRGRSARVEANVLGEIRRSTAAPAAPLRAMEGIVARSAAPQKFNMMLMSLFAGSALLLAAIGIYGLMACSVQERRREIGIRMAIGASPGGVRKMILVEGMRLALAGAAAGIGAAVWLTRFLEGFLFGVSAFDPLIFLLAPFVLCCVAAIALWVPGLRASRLEPVQVLR